MNWIDVLFAMTIALMITIVFAVAFKTRGPWGSVWAFFLIIFLAVWAASLWVNPAGPEVFGYSLIPIALVGVIFALIIASSVSTGSQAEIKSPSSDPSLRKSNFSGFSVYFWLTLLMLSIIIIFGYYLF